MLGTQVLLATLKFKNTVSRSDQYHKLLEVFKASKSKAKN